MADLGTPKPQNRVNINACWSPSFRTMQVLQVPYAVIVYILEVGLMRIDSDMYQDSTKTSPINTIYYDGSGVASGFSHFGIEGAVGSDPSSFPSLGP